MTDLLAVPTPPRWFEIAAQHLDELLLDHANCEKKAASTALALMFAYPEDHEACTVLARLAREELRHFEQVDRLRRTLGLPFRRLQPSRYGEGLRRLVRVPEPERRLDLFLLGAFIEARSCERFQGLKQVLPAPVAALYAQLQEAEARHQGVYLQLAGRAAQEGDAASLAQRIAVIAAAEAELVTAPDAQFRFHSGLPAA
jgi:tRNA-(ms[2]io[6]A)-hydroxylase